MPTSTVSPEIPAAAPGLVVLRVVISRIAESGPGLTPDAAHRDHLIHAGELNAARLSQERPDVILLDARAVRAAAVYRSIVRIRSAGWRGGIVMLIDPADLPIVPVSSSIGATDFVLSSAPAGEIETRVRRVAAQHRSLIGHRRNAETAAGIQLHWRTHEVSLGDTKIALTLREMQLLDILMQRAGDVVTATDLAGLAWGKARGGGGGLATTYVCSLRKKLAWFGGRFGIRTVRGVGYRFVV